MNKRNAINLFLIAGVIILVAGVAAMKSFKQDQVPAPAPEAVANVPASYSTTGAIPTVTQLPRLVELGGEKCLQCMQMAPVIEELKQEYAGRVNIEKIDVTKDPSAGTLYAIRLIPTQVFLKADGQEFWRHEGSLTKEEIIAKFVEMGIK